jgi:protein TonB
LVLLALAACSQGDSGVVKLPGAQAGGDIQKEQPPVALNPEPPVQYPPALFDQGIEGTVLLRLFVDSTGALRPDSTKIQESSGYPALDSAALAAAPALRFAPAKRNGVAIASLFLQPIYFRHPGTRGPTP